jgi:hypothetical protein
MTTATATATATANTAAPKVKALAYSPHAVRAALIALKGAEKGPATFEAVAPAFSAFIASGGNKVEFTAASARSLVFKELHADTLKTPTAKAFKECAAEALKDFAAAGRAQDQAGHDARLLALSAVWCSFFKDAIRKAKAPGAETSTQKVSRLEAENASLKIERDALSAALRALKATDTASAAALV